MRKKIIFKPKVLTYRIFLYKLFPIKNRPNLWFLDGQSLKLCRNTCFRGFSFFLGGELPRSKTWKVCPLKSVNFVFQKVPIWQQFLANPLRGFEYNFRCMKYFYSKLPLKLRSGFLLKLSFSKIRLLVTWLNCLVMRSLTIFYHVTQVKL